ncbi:hypothetical protein PC114_g25886, partial [Phytophthora cactorum]
MPVRKGSTV